VRAWPILATGFTLLSLITVAPLVSMAFARDHGVMGQTWPIAEPDLLTTIDIKLKTLEENGSIERMQRELVAKTEHRVRNPLPVSGISATQMDRSWLFDPSIVVENDVRDQKGNVIAARGARVNPLALIDMTTDLVFVDGRDAGQLEWATKNWSSTKSKIIFVSGSPFDAMKPWQRRFYFDQGGTLTSKFGIRHTPAVVSAAGSSLKISEVPLPREAATGGGKSS